MITLTIVRHGESTDNLRPLWAGWSDAPLSNHGMNQAKALGQSLKDTRFDYIVASDLKRAHWTAQQIQSNQATQPPLDTTQLLREQGFGEAEHQPFGNSDGKWYRKPGRTFAFPGGETLEDVRNRAKQAIEQYIEPILQESRGKPPSDKHVAVVAHGIFNSEFLGALMARRKGNAPLEWQYRGMTNTGWTRVEVGYADESGSSTTPKISTNPSEPVHPSSNPSAAPPAKAKDLALEPLTIKIISTDVTSHLSGVVRQKGGIGSQGYDAKQEDIRKFFGGGGQ
ncbi:hypothetical protein L202_06045 [Cryptococcus amylolentus CBS 6039]|uniref:Phosphoglycerate mutase n=2 Tax=Cryptococcus amylolentus TaxID=104669 RepID=A0A1E3HIE8_9TREE|nr:hypothetical protein L202_06045 [Cryptococcus amylolentus CBS 6039]ODN76113.1 hypothetical protein L202_06045 [Cryptococcus amylolentus CBS 6039]ODN97201.1 hypothetical protein I350_08181 [Cryptococcus amylolentus CBS 6273]